MGVRKIVQNISESTGARRKAEFWPPAPSKAWWYKNCKVQAAGQGLCVASMAALQTTRIVHGLSVLPCLRCRGIVLHT